uniref:Uncharacterized protein n=1 Tax=Leersia perrieri TaxID=77586 RepID=A0A0D9W2T5_9ORYZ
MPNRRARYAAAAAVAGGQIEPDWKYFLDNVREEHGSYGIHAPSDGANPSSYLHYENSRVRWGGASTSSRGRGAGSKRHRRRMMEEEPAMYYDLDPNMDEDYRVFFKHLRLLPKGGFVLEYKGKVIAYDAAGPAFSSDESVSAMGGPESNPPDRRARRQKAKNVEEEDHEEEEDVKNVVALPTRAKDDNMVKVDKRKKGKDVVAVPAWEGNGVVTAEEGRKKKNLKKEVAFPSKGKDGPIGELMVIKLEEEDEQLPIMPAVDELGTTSRPTNLINGYETNARIASGSHGVIWPIHINDRKESDFKQRLIDVLDKPFSQGEYEKLYGMATIRKQLTKERRTRLGVKYYYSNHEKGKSYLDSFPDGTAMMGMLKDLAKQVEKASHPNRLALLRGLFFWLEVYNLSIPVAVCVTTH